MELAGKVAIVTGASRGLGAHFSKALVDRGAYVFGLARSMDQLKKVRKHLGERFYPIRCDVRKEEDVRAAFQEVMLTRQRVDILINNAGLGRFGPVEQMSTKDWLVQVETNLNGVFFCTREAVPIMKAQNAREGFGGHIINIASVAGLLGNPNLTGYNATKFGVRGFSDALMKEVRHDGIKVTCVYPGSVATHFFDEVGMEVPPHAMRPEDVAATVIHVLEGPDNYLISEVVMRPLRPRR